MHTLASGRYNRDSSTSYHTRPNIDAEALSPPLEVQGYCSHINWRNPPDTSCKDISGYDMRLYNPDTGLDVTRRVDIQGTFYNLLAIDEPLKNYSTIVQVCNYQ